MPAPAKSLPQSPPRQQAVLMRKIFPASQRRRFRWPGPLADMKPDQRNLTLALVASLVIHACILAIHFKLPDALAKATDQALDIILVNSKHATRPTHAQAKAQTNLDGGGNTDEDRIASTPLPPSQQVRQGDDIAEAQRRVQELEAEQQRMMTRLLGDKSVNSAARSAEALPPQPPSNVSGLDLATRALAIARLEGQIDKQIDDYNKRPRKMFIGARTEEYAAAQYLEDWRQKVERIGNLNYPEEAKGKFYGSLTVYIEINSDGDLVRSEVRRSSGQKVLDQAALRILRLASQGGFGKFSEDMKRQTDILAFARVWSFTQADQLKSQ